MKLEDSNGGVNYIVPLSNGVLRPPHVKQIGPALALFVKLEDMVSTGNGTDGLVLGGKPVTDYDLSRTLGLHQKTISEHRQRLVAYGYIAVKRTPHGHVIRVRKSKKWVVIQLRQSAGGRSGVKEPNDSSTRKVIEPMPLVMEPNGSGDRATGLYVDQTAAGRIQDVAGPAAAPTDDPWKAIGMNLPAGTPDFQNSWASCYSHRNGESLSQAMERCIQNRQKKRLSVPKPFYDAKRVVEECERSSRSPRADRIYIIKSEEIPA